MSVITYPDGSQLTSTALTQSQIQTIFQALTIQMLGLTGPDVYSSVRIGWQIEGQPGPPINSDTVTLRCTPIDTEYGRMRDLLGSANGTETYTYTDVYTRAWKVFWTFYGPDGLNNARGVVAGLVTIPFVEMSLAGNNLYVNPSIKQPQRAPDNFQGRWWERNDLEVEFNEQITETFTVGTVGSVEVDIYNKDGLLSDVITTS